MRTGPGTRLKLGSRWGGVYGSGKAGAGHVIGKKGEKAERLTPGPGVHSLRGQTYLRSHHPWRARGASLPLEALREEEERAVQACQAWTLWDGPQAPRGREGSPPGPWL